MARFTKLIGMDKDEAREYLERLRWPNGPACPHCGGTIIYALQAKPDSKRPVRKGVYKCKECRKQFTVTVGTIFEGSHIPLNKWLTAFSLMCSSKKGISAHQLHRLLGITFKSAWFMAHRIRYAMDEGPFKEKLIGVIEADETYVGGKSYGRKHTGRGTTKSPVAALVQRDGKVKSKHVPRVTSANLREFLWENADKSSTTLMTDEFPVYKLIGHSFKEHKVIKHRLKQYVKGEVHTNTVEGYFSILKRGINGVYQHVSKKHLQRYLYEFDFRYNTRKVDDAERTVAALSQIEGKRLIYKETKLGL